MPNFDYVIDRTLSSRILCLPSVISNTELGGTSAAASLSRGAALTQLVKAEASK